MEDGFQKIPIATRELVNASNILLAQKANELANSFIENIEFIMQNESIRGYLSFAKKCVEVCHLRIGAKSVIYSIYKMSNQFIKHIQKIPYEE